MRMLMILAALLLASCQEVKNTYVAVDGGQITLNDSGSNQDRGGQTSSVLNPDVDTGDIGLPEGL
jgi:hypothetical protein